MTPERMTELLLAGENIDYHGGREFADQLIAEGKMDKCFDANGNLLPIFRKLVGDDYARGMNDRAKERMKIVFV